MEGCCPALMPCHDSVPRLARLRAALGGGGREQQRGAHVLLLLMHGCVILLCPRVSGSGDGGCVLRNVMVSLKMMVVDDGG